MTIELLFSDGCPFAEYAEKNLTEVLFEEEMIPEIRKVQITSCEDALHHKFLGSPTIRINGMDIEPHAREWDEYGVKCRYYLSHCGGMVNWPTKELIRTAIGEARSSA